MPLAQPAHTRQIDDSLDRLNITEARKRFLQINQDRLLRTRNGLNYRQELFLDVLPLLFHCNHPMLPGFVSHQTPAGVSEFRPSRKDVAAGKILARSFCQSGGHQEQYIWGIYIMGSVGTLAHTTHSDFDVWLCYKPGLAQAQLEELEQKCKRISQWAHSLRLEVHFFPMDSEAFAAGKPLVMDAESSGSAQQALLLDEFYRTAIHVAGRLPLWWFIPSAQEQHYELHAHTLLDKRFIRPGTTLDFGGLNHIPPGEFVGAAAWQLYKAVCSPYKSVLKLLLMEAYVAEYPNSYPLAMEYKQRVYDGELNIDELDPYLLIYRRIERYLLSHHDYDRLELARRCLYFKIHKPLSRAPGRRGKSWQRVLLEALVQEWGWSGDYVANLDRRPQWKALEVREERNTLVRSLNASYESLLGFANESGVARAISAHELHMLGRKLQAAFERRPEKLDWINPGISKDISESSLKITQTSLIEDSPGAGGSVWQLFSINEDNAEALLRQASSPLELLLWSYINGIIDGHVRFNLTEAPDINESQIRRTLIRLQQWLPLPLKTPDQDAFAQGSIPTRVLMVVNLGKEPRSRLASLGVQRLSSKSDPLRYGNTSDSLIASIELVTLNSWQELSCQHFEGQHALLGAIQAYMALCMPGSHQAPPEFNVECLGLAHAAVINKRISQWVSEVTGCYYSGVKPAATRYIFEMGTQYVTLQYRGPKLTVTTHGNIEQLLAHLSRSQKKYSPIVIDSQALLDHPLKAIARRMTARAINVFYQRQNHTLMMYIVDERGSLIRATGEYTRQLHALRALYIFLHSVLQRLHHLELDQSALDYGVFPIEFHELKAAPGQPCRLAARAFSPGDTEHRATMLKALVTRNAGGRPEYSFVCLGQHFSWQQLGEDVFFTTAKFIQEQRRSQQAYRAFITDLEFQNLTLEDAENLQIKDYLLAKKDVESRINQAIEFLRR